MQALLLSAAVLLPGLKPVALCPRPILINIDINHKIDRLVLKRTYYKCRRQYKKSPCLVKLSQPQKGAFQAICGETQEGLKNGIPIKPDLKGETESFPEEAFVPNCSSQIFASYLAEDWANYQTHPVIEEVRVNFCESIEVETKPSSER